MSIERYISPYIASQLPRIYREEGPMFVSFLKAYYEFLEQEGEVLSESRNLLEYRDIDSTIPEFIRHFQEKYMSGLPEFSGGDPRTLQKHIKEIYSSKGTIRGLELVFRLLSNEEIEVYYPGDDILKPSDGSWVKPTYLEVSSNPSNVLLIGEQLTGRESGATAIVEDFQIRYINRRQINLLYLSNVRGSFKTGELLLNSVITDPLKCPAVIGSMSSIEVDESGFDYKVGDVLQVVGGSGVLGKAVVANTSARSGSVEFTIRDGGSGYANDNPWAPSVVEVTTIDANNPGIGATFEVGKLGDVEIITTPVDVIGPYANVSLGSSDYGFPTFITAENINTALNQALNVQDITVGTILTLRAINPGEGYNGPVNVTVKNNVIGGLNLKDPNKNNTVKGLNAHIDGKASSGRGAIDSVKILDSGFGYQDGDVVELYNESNPFIAGGTVRLAKEGYGEGYWKDTRSFLNSDKYIQDSFYFQEYSFEVRVQLAFQRYADIIKKLWQPAGTQAFGKFVVGAEIDSSSSIEEVKIDAIFITSYVTSFATLIETDRATSTMYDSMYATTYSTQKITTTQRTTSTNILDSLTERVVNGTFQLNVSNWTALSTSAMTWDASQKMKLQVSGGAAQARQSISTTVGKTYYVRADYSGATGTGGRVVVSNSDSVIEPDKISDLAKTGSSNTFAFSFVAEATTTNLILETQGADGTFALWDNVSMKELQDVSRVTSYDTNFLTSTQNQTNRATNFLTNTAYDTSILTTFVTQQITLSTFSTNRATSRSTTTIYNTTFNTSRATNRATDTTISTTFATNRATTTAYNTAYQTNYTTTRATSTLGATSYQTSQETLVNRNTIYDTLYATNRSTDTAAATSALTSRTTDTTINTTFVTSFSTGYSTTFNTNTSFNTTTTFNTNTTFVTAFASAFATTFLTNRLTDTVGATSRLTATSGNTSRATSTSRSTTTSFNTTTTFNTAFLTSTSTIVGPPRSEYYTIFSFDTVVATSRATATSKSTTTTFHTTTAFVTNFNTTTTFNTTYATATAYETSAITSVNTSRNTTIATSTSALTSTSRATATNAETTRATSANTVRQTSFATTTAYTTSFNTSYATNTLYDTNRSTTKATSTLINTSFDTTVGTTKVTDTSFDTFTTTSLETTKSTTTLFDTSKSTAYATTTAFVTTYSTNRSTQKSTTTAYNTVFDTNTLRVTDVVTSRTTAFNTVVATLTAFNTQFSTDVLTATINPTNKTTTFVDVPTTFQTFFNTSTTSPTDYQTGYDTQAVTDTLYDTDYSTARITSINTSTDLTF